MLGVMEIILNQLAIWTPKQASGLTERLSPVGSPYTVKGSTIIKKSMKPLHRYAKNYKLGKKEFCLFVRTADADEGIEAKLDSIAKKITKENLKTLEDTIAIQGAMSFVYTDFNLEEI